MKKTIIILTLTAAFAMVGNAQEYQPIPFPTDNAVWSEAFIEYTFTPSAFVVDTTYERFAVNGEDTLMGGQSYKKLWLFSEADFDRNNARCIGGIREDDQRRVFYRGESLHQRKPIVLPDSEVMLYDFSIEGFDTIWNVDGYPCGVSAGIANVEGVMRKVLHCFYFTPETLIEGIGSDMGLLYNIMPSTIKEGDPKGTLVCFIQDGEVRYHNAAYPNCFPTRLEGIGTPLHTLNWSLFPNPAQEKMTVSVEGAEGGYTISIHAVAGAEVMRLENVTAQQTTLDLSALPQGVYCITIATNKGISTRKLVVQ